jgi:phosphatidylserine/phosphatidylglycerophosphate/cardiolipin synthase-like enzyme
MDEASRHWFLTAEERGNSSTGIDRGHPGDAAWTDGNDVRAIVHGAPYFEELVSCLRTLTAGDRVHFTDWRGDEDQILAPDGTTLGDLLEELVRNGVEVRGLIWRSHVRALGFNKEEHARLAERVNAHGGTILLDHRVRRLGSHHQKLVLLLRRGDASEDIAYVGGIDLCHGRRDDEMHRGDPQPEDMDGAYGERPPWHDVQAEVRGPAIGDLAASFRERWNDPTPMDDRTTPWRRALARFAREPEHPAKISESPSPAPSGQHTVQVLRTYPFKDPPYPFAELGERSVARAYAKAFTRARRLIYVEDQYFWSEEVASIYAKALRSSPDLRVIVVVPRHPDRNGIVSGAPHRIGQLGVIELLNDAGGDRVALYDLETEAGTPIYMHAKVVVIDDVFAAIGSDNMNRRSWTNDSELSIAVLDGERDQREPIDPAGLGDGARRFARDIRLQLWREHLGTADVETCLDPVEAFETFRSSADRLERWYREGQRGPRPRGRLRPHRPKPVRGWERPWAEPLYRLLVDPDGRPPAMKRANAT